MSNVEKDRHVGVGETVAMRLGDLGVTALGFDAETLRHVGFELRLNVGADCVNRTESVTWQMIRNGEVRDYVVSRDEVGYANLVSEVANRPELRVECFRVKVLEVVDDTIFAL